MFLILMAFLVLLVRSVGSQGLKVTVSVHLSVLL